MAKLYPNYPQINEHLNPKRETIDFIVNYSKALRVIKLENLKFEAIQN